MDRNLFISLQSWGSTFDLAFLNPYPLFCDQANTVEYCYYLQKMVLLFPTYSTQEWMLYIHNKTSYANAAAFIMDLIEGSIWNSRDLLFSVGCVCTFVFIYGMQMWKGLLRKNCYKYTFSIFLYLCIYKLRINALNHGSI